MLETPSEEGVLILEPYSESSVCFNDVIDFLYFSVYIG